MKVGAAAPSPNRVPSTAPARKRVNRIPLSALRYQAPSKGARLKLASLVAPTSGDACRSSTRITFPVTGLTRFGNARVRVADHPTTALRVYRSSRSRASASQTLKTAQKNAGCADVLPYSSWYDHVI